MRCMPNRQSVVIAPGQNWLQRCVQCLETNVFLASNIVFLGVRMMDRDLRFV